MGQIASSGRDCQAFTSSATASVTEEIRLATPQRRTSPASAPGVRAPNSAQLRSASKHKLEARRLFLPVLDQRCLGKRNSKMPHNAEAE